MDSKPIEDTKPQRNFINPDEISKHLMCTICQEVFDNPYRINCGHTYCYECISQWKKKNSNCPVCRVKFEDKLTTKDLIALNIINDLEVVCNNKDCIWKGALGSLQQHLKVCFMDAKRMPEFLKLTKDKSGFRSFKKVLMTDVLKEYKDVQSLKSSQKLYPNNLAARLKDSLSDSQLKELQVNSVVVKIDESKIKALKDKQEAQSKSRIQINKNNISQSNMNQNNISQQNINNNINNISNNNISNNNPFMPPVLRTVTPSSNIIQQNNTIQDRISEEERRMIEIAIKLSEETYKMEKFRGDDTRPQNDGNKRYTQHTFKENDSKTRSKK